MGKIIEFIIERNMLSQYRNVATHCTQFSREQRFDSITEVRSLITKGYSTVKLFLIILVLAALALAAYVYVPKIIEKSRIEKEERLAVDFQREVEKINSETHALCEKYQLHSLADSLEMPSGWKADSIRLHQQLAPFSEVESLREQALLVIENQKQAILLSRQHDFDSLLMLKALTTPDSIAAPAEQSF